MSLKWITSSGLGSIVVLLVMTATFVSGFGNDFKIYWNIPSFMCRRYNIPIANSTQYYGIIQNLNDDFRGDQISILYDPGKFPAILQNSSSKAYFYRNGGVPQQGSLFEHLEMFEQHVNELIPDPTFSGLAVIDFESWRPTYRQNFGTLKPYQDLSERLEKQRHPYWPANRIQREAGHRFEFFGRQFLEETLWLGQKIRPNATWGYYGLPHCFNGRGNNIESCPGHVKKENNNLHWLFQSVDAIFPSVYMGEQILPRDRTPMVRGRVQEALRLAKRLPAIVRPKVLVYHRYMYTDTLRYVTEADSYSMLNAIKEAGGEGIVIWGSSDDLNSKEKCTNFYNYLINTLGPVLNSLQPTYSVLTV